MKRIVLASSSPRRHKLLQQLGIPFTAVPSRVEETTSPGEDPSSFVHRMAYQKAAQVAPKVGEALIIGADTIIFHQGQIIGKPVDEKDCFRILQSLSGQHHQVMTSLLVMESTSLQYASHISVTQVTFRYLLEGEIGEYIATGEPFDKAGAYAIQGRGAAFVEGITGCFYTVMGLPLGALLPLLYKMGWSGKAI